MTPAPTCAGMTPMTVCGLPLSVTVSPTIVGSALAIILAFKNQQCYARFNEALATSGQLISSSLVFANKAMTALGGLDAAQSGPRLQELFARHYAWLTALRHFLRERRPWENTTEWGNARYLAELPAPESQSTLEDELKTYLSGAEAEQVLIEHPGVADVAVIGVPHEEMGEAVRALVVPSDPGNPPAEAELLAYCRERLAGYKCPRTIELVDTVGRTTMGKVNKRALRAPYWDSARTIGG